ncbi:MAG: hypothetical protein IBX44_03385 [Sulfurospirillum sp.]|nr:hypothetical protein [Sulfurospirillum sp.]
MRAIIYELRANDVSEEDIETILKNVKNRVSDKNLDRELEKLGYSKIFTVDYDDMEGYDDDFDDFEYIKKPKNFNLD